MYALTIQGLQMHKLQLLIKQVWFILWQWPNQFIHAYNAGQWQWWASKNIKPRSKFDLWMFQPYQHNSNERLFSAFNKKKFTVINKEEWLRLFNSKSFNLRVRISWYDKTLEKLWSVSQGL